MQRKYPKELPNEIHEFILENSPYQYNRILTEMVNSRFHIGISEAGMRSYRRYHKIPGPPSGSPYRFPAEIKEYIALHYKESAYRALANQINAIYGTAYKERQIVDYCHHHHLQNGRDTKFKSGQSPHNQKPAGYEFTKKDGFILKKGEAGFPYKHRMVWEQTNGAIPDGYCVIFLDGDRNNCTPDNLQLVSRAEHSTMNCRNLRFSDPELTRSGALVAKVICTAKERQKEMSGKKEEHSG